MITHYLTLTVLPNFCYCFLFIAFIHNLLDEITFLDYILRNVLKL